MDLEELRNRLDRLIGDIVSSAIQSNIVSEEDVERIIREANARRDENDRIDIGRIFSDEARREQLREEQQRRSEEHTSELQSRGHLVCRLLLEKKKKRKPDRRREREWREEQG